MSAPEIAGRKPHLVTLARAGERVFWCACGRSKNQPFCDGSHKDTPFRPVAHVARRDGEEVLLCACKRTQNPPFCDGSHNALSATYAEAPEDDVEAAADFTPTPRGPDGRAILDGGAFVLHPDAIAPTEHHGWRVREVIGAAAGARNLSQYLVEARSDAPPAAVSGSETVLFVVDGAGTVRIVDRTFEVSRESAVVVRPGEAFSLESAAGCVLRVLATICPRTAGWRLAKGGAGPFDAAFGERVAHPNPAARTAMADRFYQVIADARTGAAQTTQFIGEIPLSRAEMHRHLYEEAIVILSGEGWLWTQGAKAAVAPGDIIFLPMKQPHALECLSPEGMRLAGAFYPAGSPAINY